VKIIASGKTIENNNHTGAIFEMNMNSCESVVENLLFLQWDEPLG
jgi:hypothetical protein